MLAIPSCHRTIAIISVITQNTLALVTTTVGSLYLLVLAQTAGTSTTHARITVIVTVHAENAALKPRLPSATDLAQLNVALQLTALVVPYNAYCFLAILLSTLPYVQSILNILRPLQLIHQPDSLHLESAADQIIDNCNTDSTLGLHLFMQSK